MSVPAHIPLNLIDRSYLIPETDDDQGTYFPMTLFSAVKLKQAVSRDDVIAALDRLAQRAPYLRLRYRLDFAGNRLSYIPDDEWPSYCASLVQHATAGQPIEDWLSAALPFNNQPLSQPLQIVLLDAYLIVRAHHSLGDGKSQYTFKHYLLAEMFGYTGDLLPLAPRWWLPMWRLIYRDLPTAVGVWRRFFGTILGEYQNFQRDTADDATSTRQPIISGRPQRMMMQTITPDALAAINARRRADGLSLNTYLQVRCAQILCEMGLIESPITYTIPVDLQRYTPDPERIYAGNIATQIRIPLDGDVQTHGTALQEQVKIGLERRDALAGMPGEWLLLASGNASYRAVNRDWLLKSTYQDPRFFVISNVGKLDDFFAPVRDHLDHDFGTVILASLMGAPPLAMTFNTLFGVGHFSAGYDPQVLSDAQVRTILERLSSAP